MNDKLSILGSTGSIGTQALVVAKKLGLEITALTANSNIGLLEEQIRQFRPKVAAVMDERLALELKRNISDTDTCVLAGMEGLCECASRDDGATVLNSVVGMVGLEPTLCAIESGKNVALANKETLVAGGKLVMGKVKEKGVKLLPVDSEHSAIFQCLQGNDRKSVKRIILTASGGPFFGKSIDELKDMTVEDTLKHPNWSMGRKITVDSATMMNKGLEFIEAVWLFDATPDMIDIVVHRESIVHSLVEYDDNSVIAQLGVPNMSIPIQYAITYPARVESPAARLELADYGKLTFYKPDYDTFKCMDICKRAIGRGGLYPASANSANEQAVALFLDRKIRFTDIAELVNSAMENTPNVDDYTLSDVLEVDRWARNYVLELCK
ncbi:MAG: 1-deoxy-D-xylulose-5-phosphate reductoisomerase [Clostridia bacterium]|nr:1-deoxy-D-xylulose-5-phosphate reductoisomerase [Clostridia bacterium]